jgi:hypothetical protein
MLEETFFNSGEHGLHWGIIRVVSIKPPPSGKMVDYAINKYFEAGIFKDVAANKGDIIT